MLVGGCPSELSGHKLQGKLKKPQTPSEADPSRLPGLPWGVPRRDLQFRGPFLEMSFDRVLIAFVIPQPTCLRQVEGEMTAQRSP